MASQKRRRPHLPACCDSEVAEIDRVAATDTWRISVERVTIAYKTTLFLSACPMFVPSLSWQNYHLWYTNGSKEGVFQTIITLVELLARYHPHVDIPAYIYIYHRG
jgi:hypothetical protein